MWNCMALKNLAIDWNYFPCKCDSKTHYELVEWHIGVWCCIFHCLLKPFHTDRTVSNWTWSRREKATYMAGLILHSRHLILFDHHKPHVFNLLLLYSHSHTQALLVFSSMYSGAYYGLNIKCNKVYSIHPSFYVVVRREEKPCRCRSLHARSNNCF